MLILGAKGFAKEVLDIFNQQNQLGNILFYDDVSDYVPELLFGQFRVLKSLIEVEQVFIEDSRFVLGLGIPAARRILAEKMIRIGGHLTSCISPKASIGGFNNRIGIGVSIMTGAIITNDVRIGEGVLINLNCTIGHDVFINDYCALSPGVHVSGNVEIEKNVSIGTGAVLLPGVKIGENSIIGAGSVINRDIPANVVAVGVPAKIIKKLPE